MPGDASRANGRKGGRPKGSKSPHTIEKDLLREETRRLIAPHLELLLSAQIAHAAGLKYLVTRDKKTGKFIRVTEAMAKHKQASADNEEVIEVWEKDPSVHAFAELLNRLIDRAKEQPQEVKLSGTLTLEQLVATSRCDPS